VSTWGEGRLLCGSLMESVYSIAKAKHIKFHSPFMKQEHKLRFEAFTVVKTNAYYVLLGYDTMYAQMPMFCRICCSSLQGECEPGWDLQPMGTGNKSLTED
jgi:hypothetical protein